MNADDYFEPYLASQIELSAPRPDWKKVRHLLMLGLAAGDANARYALGSMYLRGSVRPRLRRDVERGVELIRQASRTVMSAMLEYAAFLEEGEYGVAKDLRAAYKMFARAAKQGSIVGRFHQARCLSVGIGVRRNRTRARRLFRECLALEFPFDGEAHWGAEFPDRG